jgi:hypothetical protein
VTATSLQSPSAPSATELAKQKKEKEATKDISTVVFYEDVRGNADSYSTERRRISE